MNNRLFLIESPDEIIVDIRSFILSNEPNQVFFNSKRWEI